MRRVGAVQGRALAIPLGNVAHLRAAGGTTCA